MRYPYVIVGGGVAGASAVEGIRAHDHEGAILLVSQENHPPYRRPPLSKDLWFGKATKDQIGIRDESWWREQNVEMRLRREIVELDAVGHAIWDDRGEKVEYGKLLLATGGRPRLLDAPGASIEGVHYFRYLEDFLWFEHNLERYERVLVVGAGFIGLELAAAIHSRGPRVNVIYTDEYPLRRVLPRDLGLFVADRYRERGVEMISGERIVSFEESHGAIVARTASSNFIDAQLVVVGVGIVPATDLADAAGLETANGIAVDEFCRTSDPDVFAAGDVAEFPSIPLGHRTRIEHFEHAESHGRAAGANMAGAGKPYDHLPMFWSDLFELGFEAVGDVDSRLTIEEAWNDLYKQGIVFYLEDEVVRGALLWNRWGLVDWARDLIREGKPMTVEERALRVPKLEG
jgi:NADPH-dependent 2,4-dienoyl-CoA reductase/sulfur reductase-like enzyme